LPHRRTRRQAGRRVHRGVRSADREADGPRRRYRHRLDGDGGREGRGARGGRGAGGSDPFGGRPAGCGPARRMSAGFPAGDVISPDTRAAASLLSGIRRGALSVFLPVFVAGQAMAWLTYAVSGWYRPWSWFKIGLAEALVSVRVAFTARSPGGPARIGPASQTGSVLEVAIGALAIAVVVLAFRAGREQARGLEERPLAAAIVGAGP